MVSLACFAVYSKAILFFFFYPAKKIFNGSSFGISTVVVVKQIWLLCCLLTLIGDFG